ncbi:MAG: hypothetical protein U9N77_06640, partial [Thermodesulfobacteriota bacterium]|nr:hypothetical protein [Thermodesulfobacteriota bacterium]
MACKKKAGFKSNVLQNTTRVVLSKDWRNYFRLCQGSSNRPCARRWRKCAIQFHRRIIAQTLNFAMQHQKGRATSKDAIATNYPTRT